MNGRGMLYTAAVLVASWSGSAAAFTVTSPFCVSTAKVTSTTYFSCTGGTHTAVDIGGVACGDTFRAPFKGNYYYQYYSGCATTCATDTTCNGGAGNYYVVTGSSGWDFRILNVNPTTSSRSQTCDSCVLGAAGGHVHFDNRQYGTRKSAWYTSVGLTCGVSAYCGTVLGNATL